MSFSFGTNTSQQNSSFGTTAKPAFSFGSTNTATTSTAGFGGFGTTTSSSGFGGFGSTASSTAAPFGTQLGTTPASTAPTLFGTTAFGSTPAKPTTGFGAGFGTNTFGAGTAFGTGTSTFGTAAPTFGTNTFGAAANTGSTFGAAANTGSTFGAAFGTKPAATGFLGFGTGLGATNTFGQPQQQQQQQQPQQQQQQGPATAHEALVAAVFNCCVFGDERDQVLAKWNLLQAQWGVGQAYYSKNAPALELNEQNPLCRFKAVGYSRLAGKEDKDGHVSMVFNKSEQEIKTNQQAFITMISNILGNKPNLAVNVESVNTIAENKTQVVIFVVDKNAGNIHISASELATFLNNGNARTTLTSSGCGNITPATKPTPHMLEQYLQTPPPGMDLRLWKQAQADNPDPENYIPVPIIGFSEIKQRARWQAAQAALQARWLRGAADTLGELRTRRAAAAATLAHLAARLHSLRHLLLQVLGREEVVGRAGCALGAEEEAVRARLHELSSQLAAPPLFNGRLNELLCAVRLQRSASAGAPQERYHLDPGAQEDVKQFLTMQQRGMAHLMDTARRDLAALDTITEGMARLVQA